MPTLYYVLMMNRLLAIYVMNISIRFLINTIDASLPSGFASKGLYVMVVDLVCEVIKFGTYVCFFALVFVYYGLPIHIVRDLWAAYFTFQKKLLNFIYFLRLTRNLDSRFANATKEQLENAESCVVCRDTLETGKR